MKQYFQKILTAVSYLLNEQKERKILAPQTNIGAAIIIIDQSDTILPPP